jgi:hypothetical protein
MGKNSLILYVVSELLQGYLPFSAVWHECRDGPSCHGYSYAEEASSNAMCLVALTALGMGLDRWGFHLRV